VIVRGKIDIGIIQIIKIDIRIRIIETQEVN
jgi:hypothetical protein